MSFAHTCILPVMELCYDVTSTYMYQQKGRANTEALLCNCTTFSASIFLATCFFGQHILDAHLDLYNHQRSYFDGYAGQEMHLGLF